MFTQEELNSLYRYCYSLKSDRDEAYDLLYASIEKYIKRPPDSDKAKFSYVRRIIRNLWIDNFRKRKLDTEAITAENEETIGYIVSDENPLETALIESQELESVWQSLTSEEREIIYLWVIEKMSIEDISSHIGRPKNTVISKIYRMRKRVKSEFLDEKKIPFTA